MFMEIIYKRKVLGQESRNVKPWYWDKIKRLRVRGCRFCVCHFVPVCKASKQMEEKDPSSQYKTSCDQAQPSPDWP